MPLLTFGNVSLISKVEHPDPDETRLVTVHYDHVRRTETLANLPADWMPENQEPPQADPTNLAGWSRQEAFRSVTYEGGIVSMHTDVHPAWVECPEWPGLEAALRSYYDVGGRPDDWAIDMDDTPSLRLVAPGEEADQPAAREVTEDEFPPLAVDPEQIDHVNTAAEEG